jgi:hypothetical protein
LASAVGVGFRDETAFRSRTSKRGIGWLNGPTPNRGLSGTPLAASAEALDTNGLSPPIGASRPVPVKRPNLRRSRRETRPHESSLTISARFFRACSASRMRAFDAFHGR